MYPALLSAIYKDLGSGLGSGLGPREPTYETAGPLEAAHFKISSEHLIFFAGLNNCNRLQHLFIHHYVSFLSFQTNGAETVTSCSTSLSLNIFLPEMAFSTSKLTELPLRSSIPLSSQSPSLKFLLFSSPSSAPKASFHILKPFSSLRTNQNPHHQLPKPRTPSPSSAPWLNNWTSPNPPVTEEVKKSDRNDKFDEKQTEPRTRYLDKESKGHNAIERIVLRLRNLGIGSDDEEEEEKNELDAQDSMLVSGEERLEDLLRREWIRPNTILSDDKEDDDSMLPWEREEQEREERKSAGIKRRTMKAPTLAELTIEDEELRRLRRNGMYLRERINVPKAGLTQAVLQKMHDKWRKEELVRLKFHETLACDMKTAHELVEVSTVLNFFFVESSILILFNPYLLNSFLCSIALHLRS